ncbi:MAG: SPOR domain-containing protein [Gammaproteobacteria bacterium]|nr:SPOR domain-containing protein [Gammaproteobacteria bacterium]MDH3750204.1 SPOR domain-containing protein [Gammaproteobacteria bacterium]MDH3804876.1 SPOR domain-containing protein [Gammaproteobacteria bacterium]
MAKRKRRRSTRTQKSQEYPGWLWMLFGLSLGLSVAFAVYVKDRQPSNTAAATAPQPASLQRALDENGENSTSEAADEEPAGKRFTFYDMLPNFEVIIPEQEPDVAADVEPKAVLQPGLYVLQAGSFSAYADADRRRAQLALHGIESKIQRVMIDDKTYHRVRIGPTSDLNELNLLRSRLRTAQIDVLRIRLGD